MAAHNERAQGGLSRLSCRHQEQDLRLEAGAGCSPTATSGCFPAPAQEPSPAKPAFLLKPPTARVRWDPSSATKEETEAYQVSFNTLPSPNLAFIDPSNHVCCGHSSSINLTWGRERRGKERQRAFTSRSLRTWAWGVGEV